MKWYAKLVVLSWALAALVTWLSGGVRNVATIARARRGFRGSEAGRDFVVGLIVAIVAAQVVLLVQMRSKPEARAKIVKALEVGLFHLAGHARRAALVLAGERHGRNLRGSGVSRISDSLLDGRDRRCCTWGSRWWVSSLIFGLGHLYQGVRGVIGTTVLGLVFAVLFVITGNLAIPILLHAAIDARVLLMVPEGLSLAPTGN